MSIPYTITINRFVNNAFQVFNGVTNTENLNKNIYLSLFNLLTDGTKYGTLTYDTFEDFDTIDQLVYGYYTLNGIETEEPIEYPFKAHYFIDETWCEFQFDDDEFFAIYWQDYMGDENYNISNETTEEQEYQEEQEEGELEDEFNKTKTDLEKSLKMLEEMKASL